MVWFVYVAGVGMREVLGWSAVACGREKEDVKFKTCVCVCVGGGGFEKEKNLVQVCWWDPK
jgi:hypothetical protein